MAPVRQADQYTQKSAGTVSLGEYIFTRIRQFGVKNIFGVPGDFNLGLLEKLYEVEGLNWVGCCNELNAAYAADGYGRASKNNGAPAVLITTFGVGELSAINGIAGAFAERSPILHIVGVSPTKYHGTSKKVHHLVPGKVLNIPDHKVYSKMIEPICCASTWLDNPATAVLEFDKVVRKIVLTSQPGYVFLPISSVEFPVSTHRLDIPLETSLPQLTPPDILLVDKIVKAIESASRPVSLIDSLASRNNGRPIVQQFLETTKFWSFTTNGGIGLIDHSNPYYCGVYFGKYSTPGIADFIESSDLVIHIGSLESDLNTGSFTNNVLEKNKIEFTHDYIKIEGETFIVNHYLPILAEVSKRLNPENYKNKMLHKPEFTTKDQSIETHALKSKYSSEIKSGIDQSIFLKTFERVLKPNDTLVCETCSIQFALADLNLPDKITVVSQPYYASIGMTLPATLGLSISNREHKKSGNIFLLEGDGSSQMTIQELGTMIRNKVKVTIFLLNNDGYSVERAILGEKRSYNDISPNWEWTNLLNSFGGRGSKDIFTTKISNEKEMNKLFSDKDFLRGDRLQLVEVIMDRMDVPWRFCEMLERD